MVLTLIQESVVANTIVKNIKLRKLNKFLRVTQTILYNRNGIPLSSTVRLWQCEKLPK